MDAKKMQRDLARDEGERLHAYVDTTGNWTIGVGHKIVPGDGFGPASILTHEQAMALLGRDIAIHWSALVAALPWAEDLDEVRQRALLNMAFNLGVPGLLMFRPTLDHVEHGEWEDVVEHLKHTKWASQVDARASRIASKFFTGVDEDRQATA